MLIYQTELFQKSQGPFSGDSMLFLTALKQSLCDKDFSCIKTKTNSHFAAKVVKRSKHFHFLFNESS